MITYIKTQRAVRFSQRDATQSLLSALILYRFFSSVHYISKIVKFGISESIEKPPHTSEGENKHKQQEEITKKKKKRRCV